MNAEAVRARVVATLSPDANVRRAAELELKQVNIPIVFPHCFLPFPFTILVFYVIPRRDACCTVSYRVVLCWVLLCYAARCHAMRCAILSTLYLMFDASTLSWLPTGLLGIYTLTKLFNSKL